MPVLATTSLTQTLILPTATIELESQVNAWNISGRALFEGQIIAFLETGIYGDCAEIEHVETYPYWRRRGIATALLNLARAQHPSIGHDDARTREGNAWALAVGGKLPRLQLIAPIPSYWD